MKKLSALALAMFLILSLFAGCAENKGDTVGNSSTSNKRTESDTKAAAEPDKDIPTVEIEITDESSLYNAVGEIETGEESANWDEYIIIASGLEVPVKLRIESGALKNVSAFGHTAEVLYEDRMGLFGNISTRLYQNGDAIILSNYFYDVGHTWIFTSEGYDEIYPEGDTCITIHADDAGKLTYKRFASKFNGAISQSYTAPLDIAFSRDDFLWEEGEVKIENGRAVVSTPTVSYTVSDKYDLDEIFESSQVDGLYRGFASVDEVLESNRLDYQK